MHVPTCRVASKSVTSAETMSRFKCKNIKRQDNLNHSILSITDKKASFVWARQECNSDIIINVVQFQSFKLKLFNKQNKKPDIHYSHSKWCSKKIENRLDYFMKNAFQCLNDWFLKTLTVRTWFYFIHLIFSSFFT